MKWNYIHLLTLICVLLLTCNGLHADEVCSPDYPDQFPFYPEEGCDDVTPLVWDHDNSATILADNSSGTIYITGGTLPLTVQVSGQGFWLDENHTIRDGVVNSRSIGVYADNDACGGATFYITDNCSSVNGSIRSTNGGWSPYDSKSCSEVGLGVIEADGYSGTWNIDMFVAVGQYRYTQTFSAVGNHDNGCAVTPIALAGCGTVIWADIGNNASQGASLSNLEAAYQLLYGGPGFTWVYPKYPNGSCRNQTFMCGAGSYEDRCKTIDIDIWKCM